jgi:carbon storage regulator
MLVLSRKPGEKVIVGGGVTVTVLEVRGGRVKIGVEAPAEAAIVRGELHNPEPSAAPRRPRRES